MLQRTEVDAAKVMIVGPVVAGGATVVVGSVVGGVVLSAVVVGVVGSGVSSETVFVSSPREARR